MIRVLIADDQAMIRGALATLLSLEDDIDVVAQCGSGDEVLDVITRTTPDVCLLDIEMPGMSGLEVAELLSTRASQCRVIIVTTFGRPGFVSRAMKAGAAGFVVKDTPAEELATAVRTVHAGGKVIDPALAAESMMEGSNPLSEREVEVLRRAATGATARTIAAELYVSAGTVRNHISSAMRKLNAANRTQAIDIARERGWL